MVLAGRGAVGRGVSAGLPLDLRAQRSAADLPGECRRLPGRLVAGPDGLLRSTAHLFDQGRAPAACRTRPCGPGVRLQTSGGFLSVSGHGGGDSRRIPGGVVVDHSCLSTLLSALAPTLSLVVGSGAAVRDSQFNGADAPVSSAGGGAEAAAARGG